MTKYLDNEIDLIYLNISKVMKKQKRPTSKYKRLYGLTLKEIAVIFKVTESAVCQWMKDPAKKEWLEKELTRRGTEKLKKAVEEMLESLTPREAEVLRMRWGLPRKEKSPMEEASKYFKDLKSKKRRKK